jgi:hypothetical protein
MERYRQSHAHLAQAATHLRCPLGFLARQFDPPPLRYKNANFGLSLARLRTLVKVLNGRQRVAFGQKAEAWRTWRTKSGFLLILRWQGFQELKTSIAAAKARTSTEKPHMALPRSS